MATRNGQNGQNGKSWAVQLGDRLSDWTSRLFAHPYMQIGVIVFCCLWFALGLKADLLTAALSILAITLTQMVLNGQYDREADAYRRDVAMHAKLDELISATKRARNDLVGVEEKEEDEIVQLKEEVKEAIENSPQEPEIQEKAKRVVDEATDELEEKRSYSGSNGRNGSKKRSAVARR